MKPAARESRRTTVTSLDAESADDVSVHLIGWYDPDAATFDDERPAPTDRLPERPGYPRDESDFTDRT